MMPKLNLKQVVLYIAETGQGFRDELVAMIGKNYYDHFCSISVLKEVFIDGKPGWKCTSEAQKLKDFYREPTAEEKQLGKMCEKHNL